MTPPREYAGGWAAVADFVGHLGIDTVFGLPSDDMDLLVALDGTSTRMVLCRDQRNAVFMGVGHAVATGRPGVCVVGKGPAVANTVTGLLEAAAAHVALLLLATGTPSRQLGTGAFQELDQVAIVRPLTKWATRVEHPDRLCAVLEQAVLVAVSGAPGPVYVELPEDVAGAPVTRTGPWRAPRAHRQGPDTDVLADSLVVLRAATRPLVLAGGGARHRNPGSLVERLADALGAGVFTTASGRGVVDESHPSFCGLAGLYARPSGRALWQEADLIVALGSGLEETATMGWEADTPVLQVNVDAAGIATGRRGTWVLADVARTVACWLEASAREPLSATGPGWRERVAAARSALVDPGDAPAAGRVRARPRVADVLAALDRVVPGDRALVQENGLQDMWSYFYPHWSVRAGDTAFAPSEQTSLGAGAAAAVGVQLARPGRPVVALIGDGAFNLFRGDLPTLADAGAPVLYVVLDNGGYGWLQSNLDRRSPNSRFRFVTGRPTGSAGALEQLGIGHARVEEAGALEPVLHRAWSHCAAGEPYVVEVAVDLADVPPGMESLAGDFPVAAATS